MIVYPFGMVHFCLLAFCVLACVGFALLFRRKNKAVQKWALIFLCAVTAVIYFVYKGILSHDSGFLSAAGLDRFNWWNELPLQLCNINMGLIPLGLLTKKRPILGFSFFLAPLGALMALLFPEPAFTGFNIFLPRIAGFYLTHILIVVCGISLATLGFYRPKFSDFAGITATFMVVALAAHGVNLLLRATVCSYANYFFTFGADISILNLFWKWIPVPFVYELPSLLILFVYMGIVSLVFRLASKKKTPAAEKAKETAGV